MHVSRVFAREVRHAAIYLASFGGLRRALPRRGPDRSGPRRSAADADAADAADGHGAAASAIAASAAAATAAASAAASAAAALATASAAAAASAGGSTTASTWAASGASASRPHPAARDRPPPPATSPDKRCRACYGNRAAWGESVAFGTGPQCSRHANALLHTWPRRAPRDGDQLPAQQAGQGAAGRAFRRRLV